MSTFKVYVTAYDEADDAFVCNIITWEGRIDAFLFAVLVKESGWRHEFVGRTFELVNPFA